MADTPSGASGRKERTRINGTLLAVSGGGLLALGHPPFGLPWLALGGLILGTLAVLDAYGWRQGFLRGWVFGAAYFAVTLHWIVEPFLVDIPRHGWMAPFALILLSGGLALFWGAAGALCGSAGPSRFAQALTWVAVLTLMEFLRSFLFTGFPWALIGTIWVDTPVAQIAAYVGPHALGLLTALPAALFASQATRHRGMATAALILPFAGLLAIGANREATSPKSTGITARLIQPNAAQHLKWKPDMIPVFFQRQIDMTAESPNADIVIWPETAIPYPLDQSGPELEAVSTAAGDAPVLLGVRRVTAQGPRNSLVAVGASGQPVAIYDKAHLVPFGEYIPFGELAARLGIRGLAAGDGGGYAPGPAPSLIDLGKFGVALPLICYEAIFPHLGRSLSRGADWMVQITNDAWFGEFAGPQQHLALARMRAIERGLPILRAANTGISAVIGPFGRIDASLALGTHGSIDAEIPGRLPPTLYVRFGELMLAVSLALCLGGAFLFRRQPN